MPRLPFALLAVAVFASPLLAAPPDFDRAVAPILARCLDCHTTGEAKGKLDLSRKRAAFDGGKNGPAIVPGKPDDSPLWVRVSADEMPPKKPLTVDEKAVLKAWIAGGATWGTDPLDPLAFSTASRAGRDWWSLQLVKRPVPPTPKDATGRVRNDIDRFILAKLEAKGLTASPPADPRVLIRRVYLDLTGLPPTPEEVDAFVKDSATESSPPLPKGGPGGVIGTASTPPGPPLGRGGEGKADPPMDAYAKLVDGLLASPRYGERWARHWLDLVRYGESDGFERNAPRPTAWHYRDWVINALNADLPYDRFARLQLAGDALHPDDPAAVKATGFLVAGTHNTVLGSNKIANDTARQDELEDVLAAVGQTFLGMTAQCARCHDHKFDPIRQEDYYRMAAAVAGVMHGERTAASAKWLADRKRTEDDLKRQVADLTAKVAAVERLGRERARAKVDTKDTPTLDVSPVARWTFDTDATDSVGKMDGELLGGAKVERGRLVLDGKGAYLRTKPLAADLTEKTLEAWVLLPTLDQGGGGVVTVENGSGSVFDSIVYAERQKKKWVPGSDNYRRTRDLTADDESSANELVHVAITYAANGAVTAYRNGKPCGAAYTPTGTDATLRTFAAGDGRVLLGRRHTGGGNALLAGEIEEARLYDKALTAEQVAASAKAGPGAVGVSTERMLAALTATERADREAWQKERATIAAKLAALPAAERAFAVVSVPPPPTHVLNRGSVEKPKQEVTAGGVASIPGADFGLTPTATDPQRRAKLAEWVARADNPLFARVIVNRLWQYHFGTGLVDTASDFGFNGGRPSHPELLDWLAAELVNPVNSSSPPFQGGPGGGGSSGNPTPPGPPLERGGEDRSSQPPVRGEGEKSPAWSLKHIHRLIVLSATYRQAATPNPAAAKVDADNRLLWRKAPTRIDAESLRDSVLAVSGALTPKMGGPGFHDVRTYGDSGTLYYEPIDKFDDATNRRSVYRFSPRGERSAVLETFDCPDPSALTPRRQTTTTPLQALALWNDAFVLAMSDKLAERVTADCHRDGKDTAAARVERAYRLALGRAPMAKEATAAATVAAKHGLAAVARVLFNCNEFVVIE